MFRLFVRDREAYEDYIARLQQRLAAFNETMTNGTYSRRLDAAADLTGQGQTTEGIETESRRTLFGTNAPFPKEFFS